MRSVTVNLIFLFILSITAEEETISSKQIPVPPFSNGGILSLWYHDYKFIREQYGEFELLNFDNCGIYLDRDNLTELSWKLVAIGNFLDKDISYATLARVKSYDSGLLLIIFRWVSPKDSSGQHGVFYRTFLGRDSLLIRTKQCVTGGLDTLEFSCKDLNRRCGKCYFDTRENKMKLRLVDK